MQLSTTELQTPPEMEHHSKKAKGSHQRCEFNEESQHLHTNILYDQIVDGAAASPNKVKLDVIFGLLAQLEKCFDEKHNKLHQNK